jgi:hypothetical protein
MNFEPMEIGKAAEYETANASDVVQMKRGGIWG